jgi:hypothetical protein
MIEIISYWFFLWFLLFIFGLIKANPFWILVISYIITVGEFFYLKSKETNNYNLRKFMIINVILKIFPILIIISLFKFSKIIKFKFYDFKFMFIIIILYIFIMFIFNKNPIDSYERMLNTYINNDNKYKTIISKLYDDIYNFWNSCSNCI